MTTRQARTLVSFSAILLAMAYVHSALLVCVFMFLIPLFCVVLDNSIEPIKDALLWGLVFWTLHYYGIIRVIYEKGEGQWRLAAGVFLILYTALYVVLWFFFSTWLTKMRSSFCKLMVWCGTTLMYFYTVQHHIFFIFNQDFGYSFAYPTILLAHAPKTLFLLPVLGRHLYLLLIIVSSACAAYAIHIRRLLPLVGCALALLPLGAGFLNTVTHKAPAEIKLFGYAAPQERTYSNAYECALIINEKITELAIRHPEVLYIVTPESAFPFFVNTCPEAISLWEHNALCDSRTLFLGGYRSSANGAFHNSLFCIQKSRITKPYDKCSLVPFIEYFPWSYAKCIRNLFLLNKNEFAKSNCAPQPLILSPTISVLPLLCSDLYFDTSLPLSTIPILCAVNDRWFTATYMQRLMYLYAKYKCMELNRDIIYVAYSRAIWISPSTEFWPLQT